MAKRYLVLAMLASALWGVSYPLTYLALRLFSINELIASSYLFSVSLLLIVLLLRGYDEKSIIKGLLISPVNYVLVYLYTKLSGGVGGLTALLSSSYIVPLIIIEYVNNKCVNARYVISAVTLLGALYLLFQGYGDSMYIALILMVMNLVYTMALVRVTDADIINFIFGQSLGTLLISYIVMRNLTVPILILNAYYYPLALAIIGNVVPYLLYAEAIKRIGPVETSLTSSIETISSLIASIPIQPLPTNPVAWALLAVSILSLNAQISRNIPARDAPWVMDHREGVLIRGMAQSLNAEFQDLGFINPFVAVFTVRFFGRRKVI
ncbi:hypothetical protein [Vulcanisaeta sp. JCM 14467]|uniref:hypothetical protein n=1 Tax=Vulcanisaeta sp. JCM 14467 TaxID=1295370 RepID=UPI0006D00D7F|nr:hypothetical protein [Vulcanisaeta sp. JCM 14467]